MSVSNDLNQMRTTLSRLRNSPGLDMLAEAKHLLDANPALVNAQDELQQTLLDYYDILVSEEAVRLLLAHGANPNSRPHHSFSPLSVAVDRCTGYNDIPFSVVQLLLEAGADPNWADKDGTTPLFWVGKHFSGQTPALFDLLRKYGADPFVRDKEGNTPLHFCYNARVCKKLLDLGLDANALNNKRQPPLLCVIEKAQGRTIGLLAQHGAGVNLRNKRGDTLLHLLAPDNEHRDAIGIRRLLKAGADIEARDRKGRTPLHLAAGAHYFTAVRALLEFGADVEAKDNKGRTPLDIVLSGEYLGYNDYYEPEPKGYGDPENFRLGIRKVEKMLKKARKQTS